MEEKDVSTREYLLIHYHIATVSTARLYTLSHVGTILVSLGTGSQMELHRRRLAYNNTYATSSVYVKNRILYNIAKKNKVVRKADSKKLPMKFKDAIIKL